MTTMAVAFSSQLLGPQFVAYSTQPGMNIPLMSDFKLLPQLCCMGSWGKTHTHSKLLQDDRITASVLLGGRSLRI